MTSIKPLLSVPMAILVGFLLFPIFQNCAAPNDISTSDLSSKTTGVWPGSTDPYGNTLYPPPPAVPAPSPTPSPTPSPSPTATPVTCVANGQNYSEGAVVYGNPCPGIVCMSVVGPQLTCHSGHWYYYNGADLCSTSNTPSGALSSAGIEYLRSMGCSI